MQLFIIEGIMEISELYTYPVKSLAGISLETAELERTGIRYDRQWMVVEPDGTFMTQREFPQMALIETDIIDGRLQLATFGMESVTVDEPDIENNERVQTDVWGTGISAIRCEGPANEWLSDALGTACGLVTFPRDEPRQCNPEHANQGDSTFFADGYPVLVVSQESLDDLNGRLSEPVGMDRFRPNLVIRGTTSFAEDTWKNIEINNVGIRMAKPCDRCSVPTVDPQRGMLAGPEPIATLSTYRERDGMVYFGMNAIPEYSGTVSVGDMVRVLN